MPSGRGAGRSVLYLDPGSGWARGRLAFLEGAGAGLLREQYCWRWPRAAGMSWRERCHRRPGAAGAGAAAEARREAGPRETCSCRRPGADLLGCRPPPPPRRRRPAWRCTGRRGTAPAPAGRRRRAAAGAGARRPGGTGAAARSRAAGGAGPAPAPRAPAACARPRRAVCAFRLPGGCNTLLPVASAGGNRKSAKVRVGGPLPTRTARKDVFTLSPQRWYRILGRWRVNMTAVTETGRETWHRALLRLQVRSPCSGATWCALQGGDTRPSAQVLGQRVQPLHPSPSRYPTSSQSSSAAPSVCLSLSFSFWWEINLPVTAECKDKTKPKIGYPWLSTGDTLGAQTRLRSH